MFTAVLPGAVRLIKPQHDPLTLMRSRDDPGLYVWRGQRIGREDGWSVWHDVPAPVGGEQVSMGNLDMRALAPHEDLTSGEVYIEVPCTAWGDYAGSLYERANCLALRQDYPDTFIALISGFGGECLLLPVNKPVDEHLLEILHKMQDDYPIYDEERHSQIETDLAHEAWDDYLARDLFHDLMKAGLDEVTAWSINYQASGPGSLRELYYEITGEMPEYPYGETAVNVVFPYHQDVVAELAKRLQPSEITRIVRDGLASAFDWLDLPPAVLPVLQD